MKKIPVGKILASVNLGAAVIGADSIIKRLRRKSPGKTFGNILLESVITSTVMVPATLLSYIAWNDESLNIDAELIGGEIDNVKAALTFRKDVVDIMAKIQSGKYIEEEIRGFIDQAVEKVPEEARKLMDVDKLLEALETIIDRTYHGDNAETKTDAADEGDPSKDETKRQEIHDKIINNYNSLANVPRAQFFQMVADLVADTRSGWVSVDEARELFHSMKSKVKDFMENEDEEAEQRFERDMIVVERKKV